MAQPLRRQIVLLNLSILVPVFAVVSWSALRTYREQITQLEEEGRSIVSTVVVSLERGVDLTAVQTVISAIPLAPGAVVTITDDRSVVLARSHEPELYVGHRVESAPLPAAEVPATVTREGVDGIERVFSNAIFRPGPWLVSVGLPTAIAVGRVEPIIRRNLAISVGAILFTFVVEWFWLRPFLRAFDRATRFARRLADGDLTAPKPMSMPSHELERLQNAVIDMVVKLREAREAVAAQVADERRIRLELESLQRQVIRQERLAAIGVLVSGVAHELNNPLQAILGFAELLQMREDLPASVRSELALIQKESARASVIIRNLSRFSRQQTPDASPVRLTDVIASVVELLRRKLEEQGIELQVEEDPGASVMAVFPELQQVVLNFVINAEQAVMQGGLPRRITVRTSVADGRVCLEVEDSGPGVSPEHEANLFQPFFTTKPVGEGTGLGLSVSYGIIQSLGGTIGYRRAPGAGAQFYFELPALAVAALPS